MKAMAMMTLAIGMAAGIAIGADAPKEPDGAPLRFESDGKGFRFDTGVLKGRLRAEGKSTGLSEVRVTGVPGLISSSMGLFSHYRLLDDSARYGVAGWEWASEGALRADGSVEANWKADDAHPFGMKVTYRWVAPDTLEVATSVAARKPLRGFEVFLASYFKGFGQSLVWVRTDGANRLMEVLEKDATWHMFPRDDAGVGLIRDGRWKREPNPVDWAIRPPLAAPLAMRRDAASDLVGLVMASPADCFAIATPFGAEGHRSLYLSLFGKDLKEGETATARARLVIGRKLGEEEAVTRYQGFLRAGTE